MDGDSTIYLDAQDRILGLMRKTFGNQFKNYYYGDPVRIPKENLPSMIVQFNRARISQDASMTDLLTTELRISILLDKSADFNASDNIDMTESKLKRWMVGRNATTKSWDQKSVIGVLRTNLTLGLSSIDVSEDLKMILQPRFGIITSEAQMTIQVTEKVIRLDQNITL